MRRAAAVVALALAGCATTPYTGTVVSKYIEPESTTIIQMPHTTCTGGKNSVCTTWYSFMPVVDDADYVLVVRDAEGKDHRFESEPAQYEGTAIGTEVSVR